MNRGLYHVVNSPDPLQITINNRLGRIGPDDCLLSGDPVRCRINALLCNNKKEAGLYSHPLEKEDERLSVTMPLMGLLPPDMHENIPFTGPSRDQRIFHI